jgi:hypothetical protein
VLTDVASDDDDAIEMNYDCCDSNDDGLRCCCSCYYSEMAVDDHNRALGDRVAISVHSAAYCSYLAE